MPIAAGAALRHLSGMALLDRPSKPGRCAARRLDVVRGPDVARGASGPAGVLLLALSLAACSSSSGGGDAPEAPGALQGGAGGDVERGDAPGGEGAPGSESAPGGEGTPGGATPEVQDPSRIGNVPPPAAEGRPEGELAPPEPSAGCGQPALVGSGPRSVEVDGVARTFILDVPSGYDGAAPLPLVFAFHGATTSGELFRSRFYGDLLSAMADEALVVHADALGDPSAWDAEVDVPFFDAMLAALAAEACVDQARVFATGHSSGGFFTNTLGCQRGDVLRAIAPVSAGGPFVFGTNACRGEVAVWLAHAPDDEVVPFDLGLASRDRWLEANGCSDTMAAVEPAPCVEYAGCSLGLPVRWCEYDDGHDWPDFGPEGIWGFFEAL